MPRKKKVVVEEPNPINNTKKEIMQNLFDNSVIEFAMNGFIKQNTYALIESNKVVPLKIEPIFGFKIEDIVEKELDRIKASAMITVGVGALSFISEEMKKKLKKKYKDIDISKMDQADIPVPVPSLIVVYKEKYGNMAMLHSQIHYDMKGTPYTKEEVWVDNIPAQTMLSSQEPISTEKRTNY
jgi:hypothetical protein